MSLFNRYQTKFFAENFPNLLNQIELIQENQLFDQYRQRLASQLKSESNTITASMYCSVDLVSQPGSELDDYRNWLWTHHKNILKRNILRPYVLNSLKNLKDNNLTLFQKIISKNKKLTFIFNTFVSLFDQSKQLNDRVDYLLFWIKEDKNKRLRFLSQWLQINPLLLIQLTYLMINTKSSDLINLIFSSDRLVKQIVPMLMGFTSYYLEFNHSCLDLVVRLNELVSIIDMKLIAEQSFKFADKFKSDYYSLFTLSELMKYTDSSKKYIFSRRKIIGLRIAQFFMVFLTPFLIPLQIKISNLIKRSHRLTDAQTFKIQSQSKSEMVSNDYIEKLRKKKRALKYSNLNLREKNNALNELCKSSYEENSVLRKRYDKLKNQKYFLERDKIQLQSKLDNLSVLYAVSSARDRSTVSLDPSFQNHSSHSLLKLSLQIPPRKEFYEANPSERSVFDDTELSTAHRSHRSNLSGHIDPLGLPAYFNNRGLDRVMRSPGVFPDIRQSTSDEELSQASDTSPDVSS